MAEAGGDAAAPTAAGQGTQLTDEVTIISLDERERWDAAHASGGLPGQSWSYADAYRATGIAPRLAVVEAGGSRMLLPHFERDWRGATDVATLIGLSGATISPASPAPLSAWRDYATARGWVAGYLQLAPETPDLCSAPEDDLVASNEVFLLDVGEGDPLAAASEIVRRKVRRADREGTQCVEDRGRLADAMVRLYPQAMQRLRMPPRYHFPEAALRAWTMDPASVALGAEVAGRIEAVSLFPFAGAQAEYHLNACSDDGRHLSAWLIARALERLSRRGVRCLNLGGGIRPGDGLHDFKARFHGRAVGLRALRQVYDRPRYDALCREAGVDPGERWFPAYRAGGRDGIAG